MQETQVQFLGQEDLLEKEMAIHSSILAWEIPLTEEHGRLPSTEVIKSLTRLKQLSSWCAGLKNMHFWALLLSDEPSSVLCSDFCIFTHLARANEIRINYSYLCPEKAMAPHSRPLAWRIPWTEETGRLQSMGLLRVIHD